MTSFAIIVCMFAVMAIGSMVQSIAGMGFGMVVVPVLSLMIGSADGVLLGNLAGTVTAGMLAYTKRQDTEWKKVLILFLSSLPGVILTALLLSHLPHAWLDFVVGGLMMGLVVFSLTALRFPPVYGMFPLVMTGFISGILSTTVAQSGPIMAAYAQAARWKQRAFAATLQPYFLLLNLVVIPSKMMTGLGTVSFLTPSMIIGSCVVIIISALIAVPLTHYVSAFFARNLAIGIAGIGAIIIFVRGTFALITN
ncbi:MAG: sulfite exporter TauE/SafE family protein [Actinomycetaceae bacterium]|nr:sulfite exporter TauE/SafE family protein [Actinomycetaceae bacterium]